MVMLLWISSFALAASEQQTLLQTKVEVVLEVDDVVKRAETCDVGFFPAEDGTCVTCGVDNCNHCPEGAGGCQECANGFHLDRLAPASCIPCNAKTDCTHCSIDPSKCDLCPAASFLDLDEGTCTQSKIEGCGEFKYVEGELTCERCLDHHRKRPDGSCVKCDESNPHCRSCDAGAAICDKCDPGFFLNSQTECVACEAENCELCNDDLSKCSACRVGYTMDDGNCVKCHQSGCHVCDTDRWTCDKCRSNFVLHEVGGTCCGPCPAGTEVEVCAFDNKTYSNACEAGCANQHVKHQGLCTNDCADVKKPVCGSDRKIYDNECKANAAGVGIVCISKCSSKAKSETE